MRIPLLFFPGMSSPFHFDYASGHDLLRKRGKERSVEANILHYLGQSDANGSVNENRSLVFDGILDLHQEDANSRAQL